MIKQCLLIFAFSSIPSKIAAQPLRAPCSAAQAVRLDRPATQGDLSAAGIDLDIRTVTLFVKFKPSMISLKQNNADIEAVSCQLSLAGTPGEGRTNAIYLTPERYMHVRHVAHGDTLEGSGFDMSPVFASIRKGKITSFSYKEDEVRSGLVAVFIQSENKYSYYIQFRVS